MTSSIKKSTSSALLLLSGPDIKILKSINHDKSFPSYQGRISQIGSFDVNQKNNQINTTDTSPSSSITGIRILLVDDEPDIARLFKLALERNGYAVDVFNDPILALSDYKTGMYSLLLFDLKMPKMNGFELYQRIKDKEDANNTGVKICFITAFEEYYRELQESFPNLEIDCFIRKPISIDELVKVVKTKLNS
jgi:two-component system, OmpR family, response regulator ChvI